MKVQFVVRYVNGLKDTIVEVDSTDPAVKGLTAQRVRSEIRKEHPELSTKRLKLLHNGRVLSSQNDFSKEIQYLQDGEEGPVRIYFHCIVGEDLTKDELAKEASLDQQPVKSTSEAPKGFNRLLSQGFSETDIEELRQQFLSLHGRSLPPNATREQVQQLEDRWIDSTVGHDIDEFPANIRFDQPTGNTDPDADEGGAGTVTGNTANTRHQMIRRNLQAYKDLFIGVCVGFALGGLAIVLLFLEVGGVFSKKTRMAIVSGVIVNISFGILRNWGGE